MLDDIDDRQRYGLVAAFVAVAVVGFGVGSFMDVGLTGAMTAGASTDDIREEVQGLMDQQVQSQQQRFALIANQSENISMDDLSLQAEVTDVSQSEFGSLYEVTVQMSGTVPSQTGGLQSLDQDQTFFISQDGRYLFQEPTDLQQPQGQQPSQPQTR